MNGYLKKNQLIRIERIDKIEEHYEAPLRAFFRHIGLSHAYGEFLTPVMRSGRAALFLAVQDRPWPSWGIGSFEVRALICVFPIEKDWASVGNVFLLDEELANINLAVALYATCLEYLANDRGVTQIHHVVDEESILAGRVLQRFGFVKTGHPYIASNKNYEVYSAPIDDHRATTGLGTTPPAALMSGALSDQIFDSLTQLLYATTIGTMPFWSHGSSAPDVLPNAFAHVFVSGGAPKRRS